jgi:hypothetical protein
MVSGSAEVYDLFGCRRCSELDDDRICNIRDAIHLRIRRITRNENE